MREIPNHAINYTQFGVVKKAGLAVRRWADDAEETWSQGTRFWCLDVSNPGNRDAFIEAGLERLPVIREGDGVFATTTKGDFHRNAVYVPNGPAGMMHGTFDE